MPKQVFNSFHFLSGQYAALIDQTGKLISPDYNFTQSDYCLDFWYFLEGDRETKLKVQKYANLSDWNREENVWTDVAEPNVPGQWLHSRATLTRMGETDSFVSTRNLQVVTNKLGELSLKWKMEATR